MAIVQRAHPQLSESYYVMVFIAGLKENIKHYLIPHSPITLNDCYWKSRELEKGNARRKFFPSSSSQFQKFPSSLPQSATKQPGPQAPATSTPSQP